MIRRLLIRLLLRLFPAARIERRNVRKIRMAEQVTTIVRDA